MITRNIKNSKALVLAAILFMVGSLSTAQANDGNCDKKKSSEMFMALNIAQADSNCHDKSSSKILSMMDDSNKSHIRGDNEQSHIMGDVGQQKI